ncbi:MAG TPA: aspartate aminotransferase family protein [Candidatus Hydrogenedens sp.]|nr:aspartate aminotransferase family protein [Candidatus Hydrogenedens sp.]HPP59879.1 aspartate aminotransferase family protein [Candidatus Hydrogenedens sp.]
MVMMIPEKGKTSDEVLKELESARQNDARWEEGRIFSLVFHHSDEHSQLIKEAYGMYIHENGLNPMAFLSLRKFESEVVQMTASLLHGDSETVGCMTSGGTESILLAMKTYRDKARKERKKRYFVPEVVLPDTAHVAFEKAGEYFDIRMIHAPVDKKGKVDIKAMERRITPNTVALVGSAPNYPYGTIDPIEELSELAIKYNLGLHVDACVGGFVLPWFERLGEAIPRFDFRVPGVTSISADLHKYGYSAKGASVILYRSIEIMKHQIFVYVNWPGGIFMSPGITGTRPGGAIASAWATLMRMGQETYLENAQKLIGVIKRFQEGIKSISELEIIGDPQGPLFAYCSKDERVNIYSVADLLEEKGWHIDRQQKPPSIHFMINPIHEKIVDEYIRDLKEAVEKVKEHPELAKQSKAPTYGMMANVPLRGLVESEVRKIVANMFKSESQNIVLDEPNAPVNGLNILKTLLNYLKGK